MKRIIYLLLIVSGLNAYGQGYDYPIKPGTEEYKSLKSHKDIVDNFQIPDIVIEQMTTDELLEAYIHYPLLFDAFAFSNLETGLEKVSKNLMLIINYKTGLIFLIRSKKNYWKLTLKNLIKKTQLIMKTVSLLDIRCLNYLHLRI